MSVQDRRRILGPAEAKPLQFAAITPVRTVENRDDGNGNKSGKESVFISTDLVTNANGSSYLEYMDGTSDQVLVMSSVFGPRPLRGSFQSKASVSIQFKEVTLEHLNTGEIKEICTFLTNVFNAVINVEKYPKSGIDIFIDLIQHSNSNLTEEANIVNILPTCINSITMALVDAGIEIIDLVSAGSKDNSVVAFIRNGHEIVGIWSDDDNVTDISKLIEECKAKYLVNKQTLVQYLK